jgi:hypothetical protein
MCRNGTVVSGKQNGLQYVNYDHNTYNNVHCSVSNFKRGGEKKKNLYTEFFKVGEMKVWQSQSRQLRNYPTKSTYQPQRTIYIS